MDLEEKVFVLLPVHNRRQVTEKFVECLRRQTYRHWDLILVDDGSTDGTAEAGRSMIDSVPVLPRKGKWWWAGRINQPTGVFGAVDFLTASGPVEMLRRSLAKKSRINPVNRVIFILLASDWPSLVPGLMRLLQRIGREIVEKFGRSSRGN